MYKVFVNNKPLYFSNSPMADVMNVAFNSYAEVHEAVEKLKNNENAINIHHPEIEEVFQALPEHMKTIYAAGGVVVNPQGEVLMIYRFEKWDLPKGKIEEGEAIEEAAVREVEEECGISNLKIVKQLADTYHVYETKVNIFKVTHWYAMEYAGDEKLKPQTEEGIDDVRWAPVNKLHDLLKNSYCNVIDLLDNHFSLYLSKTF
ncbi:MAG: NUDIX domain-containing protein [Weeksellaceae bacterium]|nr:NUDIX domain-containing protein [Weeksellaceae bacterium]